MPKPKKCTISVIERPAQGELPQVYQILDKLVVEHHEHLLVAKIVIAWREGWTEDEDGRLVLGRAKRASELDAALHGYDFVILLNHEAWNAADFSSEQMTALLDHELCHCQAATDDNGEQKVDEAGSLVWRIRKHDIEEFKEVVARHGCWRAGLEDFARAALTRKAQPLLQVAKG